MLFSCHSTAIQNKTLIKRFFSWFSELFPITSRNRLNYLGFKVIWKCPKLVIKMNSMMAQPKHNNKYRPHTKQYKVCINTLDAQSTRIYSVSSDFIHSIHGYVIWYFLLNSLHELVFSFKKKKRWCCEATSAAKQVTSLFLELTSEMNQ